MAVKPTILVTVGNETFAVKRCALTNTSRFFAAALADDRWKEGQTSSLSLPEDDPDVFAIYIDWLDRGKIEIQCNAAPSLDQIASMHIDLARAYVLGEKLQDTSFRNSIITALVKTVDLTDEGGRHKYPCPEAIRILYEGTCEGSAGRQFLVDLYARNAGAGWIEEDMHPEFMQDLVKCLLRERKQPAYDGKATLQGKEKWFVVER